MRTFRFHGVVGPAVGVIARSGFVFGFRRLDSGEAEEDEAFSVGEVQDVAGLSERGERGEADARHSVRLCSLQAIKDMRYREGCW